MHLDSCFKNAKKNIFDDLRGPNSIRKCLILQKIKEKNPTIDKKITSQKFEKCAYFFK